MRITTFLSMFFIVSLVFFSGCEKDDDSDFIPVYLEDFTEYAPVSKSYLASDIKSYFNEAGLSDLSAKAKYDIKVYKIKYKTALEGDSITASGLLAVPVTDDNSHEFPMLSYQHSTMTTNAEAPTSNPLGTVTSMATFVASTGFIVVIPDYIGFGASSNVFHPYMIKKYAVNAVLDMIRASKEFVKKEKPCKFSNKLFLSGYSQGGSATLAALSAIENNTQNSDLKVTASACGAGFYNLNFFRNWMVSQVKYDQPFFFAYLLKSYKLYAGLNIEDTLVYSSNFEPILSDMFNGSRTGNEMNEMFGTRHVGELFNDEFEKDSTDFNADENYAGLRAALADNSVAAWNVASNVTLYYGKEDMTVPNEQSLKLYSEFRVAGATSKVKVDAIDGLNHETAEIPILAKSVIWFTKN